MEFRRSILTGSDLRIPNDLNLNRVSGELWVRMDQTEFVIATHSWWSFEFDMIELPAIHNLYVRGPPDDLIIALNGSGTSSAIRAITGFV